MERDPRRMQRVGQALGMADDRFSRRFGADQRQHAVAGGPGAGHAGLAHPVPHVLIHVLRRLAQRDLAQCGEVALLEVALQRPAGGVGAVNAAAGKPRAQLGGRDVNQLNLVGTLQHAVGQGFGDAYAGDAGNVVIQAFQVLDVQRGPDMQAGIHQLLHILPPLVVAAARGVGMGQLVHQQQAGMAEQGGVQVKLL